MELVRTFDVHKDISVLDRQKIAVPLSPFGILTHTLADAVRERYEAQIGQYWPMGATIFRNEENTEEEAFPAQPAAALPQNSINIDLDLQLIIEAAVAGNDRRAGIRDIRLLQGHESSADRGTVYGVKILEKAVGVRRDTDSRNSLGRSLHRRNIDNYRPLVPAGSLIGKGPLSDQRQLAMVFSEVLDKAQEAGVTFGGATDRGIPVPKYVRYYEELNRMREAGDDGRVQAQSTAADARGGRDAADGYPDSTRSAQGAYADSSARTADMLQSAETVGIAGPELVYDRGQDGAVSGETVVSDEMTVYAGSREAAEDAAKVLAQTAGRAIRDAASENSQAYRGENPPERRTEDSHEYRAENVITRRESLSEDGGIVLAADSPVGRTASEQERRNTAEPESGPEYTAAGDSGETESYSAGYAGMLSGGLKDQSYIGHAAEAASAADAGARLIYAEDASDIRAGELPQTQTISPTAGMSMQDAAGAAAILEQAADRLAHSMTGSGSDNTVSAGRPAHDETSAQTGGETGREIPEIPEFRSEAGRDTAAGEIGTVYPEGARLIHASEETDAGTDQTYPGGHTAEADRQAGYMRRDEAAAAAVLGRAAEKLISAADGMQSVLTGRPEVQTEAARREAAYADAAPAGERASSAGYRVRPSSEGADTKERVSAAGTETEVRSSSAGSETGERSAAAGPVTGERSAAAGPKTGESSSSSGTAQRYRTEEVMQSPAPGGLVSGAAYEIGSGPEVPEMYRQGSQLVHVSDGNGYGDAGLQPAAGGYAGAEYMPAAAQAAVSAADMAGILEQAAEKIAAEDRTAGADRNAASGTHTAADRNTASGTHTAADRNTASGTHTAADRNTVSGAYTVSDSGGADSGLTGTADGYIPSGDVPDEPGPVQRPVIAGTAGIELRSDMFRRTASEAGIPAADMIYVENGRAQEAYSDGMMPDGQQDGYISPDRLNEMLSRMAGQVSGSSPDILQTDRPDPVMTGTQGQSTASPVPYGMAEGYGAVDISYADPIGSIADRVEESLQRRSMQQRMSGDYGMGSPFGGEPGYRNGPYGYQTPDGYSGGAFGYGGAFGDMSGSGSGMQNGFAGPMLSDGDRYEGPMVEMVNPYAAAMASGMTYRNGSNGGNGSQRTDQPAYPHRPAQQIRMSDAEIQRSADRIYKIIKDKIKLERRSMGLS